MTEEKSTLNKAVLAILVVTVVLLIAGGIYVYTVIPVKRTLSFTFAVVSGAPADVFINEKKAGTTDLTMTYEQIKAGFVDDLRPATWPPAGVTVSSSSRRGSTYRFEMADVYEESSGSNIMYIYENDDGKVTMGAFRVKLEDGKGNVGELIGGGGLTQREFKQEKREETFRFRMIRQPEKTSSGE